MTMLSNLLYALVYTALLLTIAILIFFASAVLVLWQLSKPAFIGSSAIDMGNSSHAVGHRAGFSQVAM